MLFSMPYLLSTGSFENFEKLLVHTWIPLVFYAICFYANYFYFGDLLLSKNHKRQISFFLINISLLIFFLLIAWLIKIAFLLPGMPMPIDMPSPPPGMPAPGRPPFKLFMYKDIISYCIPVIFALAVKISERFTKAETQHQEAEKERLNSELEHLKYQLQPHFFFNSLNNIYALIDIRPTQAKESVHSLSKLMRYMLYESNTEKVTLRDEIEFLTRYIELMQIRLSDKTHVHFDSPKLEREIEIAPLLFISLVENAFKHGVSATQQTNIEFSLIVSDKQVLFVTENENIPKLDQDKSGSGIGLQNLKKRLILLYPDHYSYKQETSNNRYRVELSIDI